MRTSKVISNIFTVLVGSLCSLAPAATNTRMPARDNPPGFSAPTGSFAYITRTEMIPMRDGVRLSTVILMMKGANDAPILLHRTPYGTKRQESRSAPEVGAIVRPWDYDFIADGYILVFQNVRGINGSEGEYVTTRPLIGPLNNTSTDESTDAFDTIDWLVKNVPQTNGRVGIIGGSYGGFLAAMALINPHPALKAAVPISPMIDGWRGDDWFHNGAARFGTADFLYLMAVSGTPPGPNIPRQGYDDYENFLRAGTLAGAATAGGVEKIPFWHELTEHPAYDSFWQEQAVDRLLARQPLKVPTLWVGALWDQEDIYGAVHAYAAVEPKDTANNMNFLALGPWRHGASLTDGSTLGALQFPGDTALAFRREVLKPFMDQRLETHGQKADTPPVYVFQTGTDRWQRLSSWPTACETGCASGMKPLYLQPGKALSFVAPAAAPSAVAVDEYVSDPANPVPFVSRPIRHDDDMQQWSQWLVSDQRHVDGRPDVLTYVTEPLTAPLSIAGAPLVDLFASTSGTDSDWVVKLIDVYPDTYPAQPELGGYELGIAMDILRGRYRNSPEHPTAIPANEVQRYRFELPHANHVFLPGHRIMVQIQSSWFPLYDRNPQTFVPNIFLANPDSYRKATQRVFHAGVHASAISLPVVNSH